MGLFCFVRENLGNNGFFCNMFEEMFFPSRGFLKVGVFFWEIGCCVVSSVF